ncbi:MAG: crossover junction endodeoxyribonuclease RuvC [Candidatus Eisenbacteria bacterium]|nr:crossover junction endodeoxyribonuclease RuvC [Candidatus Eisenbacteria bacterium]
MRTVLGIDPGSVVTGWALVRESGSAVTCVASGQLSLGGGALTGRLTALYRGLSAVLDAHRPDSVAVESPFQAKNARSALVLGHARGVILLAAGLGGLDVAEYAPREVKMAVAGRGSATKEQVQYMVRRLLSLPKAPRADEADAMALALCHLHRARHRLPARTPRKAAGEAALWRAKAAQLSAAAAAPRSGTAPAPPVGTRAPRAKARP